jgi:exosortase
MQAIASHAGSFAARAAARIGALRDERAQHELLAFGAVIAQFAGALAWLVRSWLNPTYESWGFLPLLLLVVVVRRLPPRRAAASVAHLWALVAVAAVDLGAAPLRLNVLRAALAVVALHLWLVAFRNYRGRWYLHAQLWVGLLCLPVVYWANALCGFHVQKLCAATAAASFSLYGLPVATDGTLLRFPGAVIAVDASCSGMKMLFAGVLLGLLATWGPMPARRRLLFWAALAALFLAANVLRVICLAVAHLGLGRAPSETAHQGIGIAAFLVAAATSLLLLRWLQRSTCQRDGARR